MFSTLQLEISFKMSVLRPSETAWGLRYDLFCVFMVFHVHLCGSFVAGLAGAKFVKIFNVYLCGSFVAGLAGANFFKIFNIHLCGSSVAGLAGAKFFKT